MKASYEERKAKMRAYYQANKDKWKKYNREVLTRMSDDEREAHRQKQREYERVHYQANRDRIIARTSQYQKDNADKSAAYQAKWYQANKAIIAARRRHHYHVVVKPRQQAAKEASQFLSIREAVTLLGAKLWAFREWVYQGRIEAVRSPGGGISFAVRTLNTFEPTAKTFPGRSKNDWDWIQRKIRNERGTGNRLRTRSGYASGRRY